MKPGDSGERWLAISRSLDHALDLPESEREAWLANLARESPDIAAEVRTMLALQNQPEFAEFLAGDSPPLPADLWRSGSLAGQRVGPYELESEIGSGGMGSVWLARRADGQYEGRAAIKFLHLARSGSEGRERFRREAQVLAQLSHPNIARLLDAGVLAESQPYLVLEYIEGERIHEYCDKHRLDVRARVRLFLDVLAAVAHAHRHLIIHRDIKPANILVTSDGTVKLLDFGIARLVGEDADVTRAGGQFMTPEYAAPEQVRGESVTTATDVYALGLMLYVLLAGQHPFAGSRSAAELVYQILEADAKRASTLVRSQGQEALTLANAAQRATTPVALQRMLRGDLDNILLKALRKNPAERYPTADAFADDLRRFLTHQPVSARPDTLAYRTTKFVRRHRAAVAAGVLLVSTLAGAAIVTTSQMLEARAQRDEAQFQARRAESANEFLNVLMLSDGGPEAPRMGTIERLNLGVDMLERQYGEDPRFAGRMLVQLAGQFRGLTQTRRSVEVAERAYALGVAAQDPELMALAQCAAAYAEALGRVHERSAGRIAESTKLLQSLDQPSVAVQIDCLRADGQVAHANGDFDGAIERLMRARRLLEETDGTHRAVYASILTDLGGVYLARNQLNHALRMTELVAATHERYGRGGTAARLVASQNRAVVLFTMGEAREALRERLEINRRHRQLEPEGAGQLAYPVNHAALLVRLARPHEALQILNEVGERARRVGHGAWLMQSLLLIGWAQTDLQHWEKAEAALTEAAQLAERNPEGNRELRMRVQQRLAELNLARGDLEGARRHIETALTIAEYPDGAFTRATDEVLITASNIALREGRAQDAASYARAALAAGEAVARGSDTSADVGEALLRLARAQIALGRVNDARPLLERAERCLANGLDPEHPLTREARAALASTRVKT
ncbi:MAG TPA: protein kinase [Steroidobacteraceae bacterium]